MLEHREPEIGWIVLVEVIERRELIEKGLILKVPGQDALQGIFSHRLADHVVPGGLDPHISFKPLGIDRYLAILHRRRTNPCGFPRDRIGGVRIGKIVMKQQPETGAASRTPSPYRYTLGIQFPGTCF